MTDLDLAKQLRALADRIAAFGELESGDVVLLRTVADRLEQAVDDGLDRDR